MSEPREVYALIYGEKSHYQDLYNDNLKFLQSIQREKDELVTFIEKSAYDELKEKFDRACHLALERKHRAQKYKDQADKLAEALRKVNLFAEALWWKMTPEQREYLTDRNLKHGQQALAEYRGEAESESKIISNW
jgi:hypothetical protein